MTMREIFQITRKKYFRRQITRFPIYLNMRDHFGQTDPTEILERHARYLGFTNPSHLVRAWRSGYAMLLIDGFDEVTTLGFQGAWKKLRDTRFRSMEAIRKFVRDTPIEAGIIIAGRPHFFDNESERRTALNLNPNFICLSLSEFNDEQLHQFLKKSGNSGTIPLWMPGRPLLVAYLVARELIAGKIVFTDSSREEGWNHLLEGIANREAQIEAGIDGHTVRRILERLATKARTDIDGLGPITTYQIIEAFEEICGYSPGEEALVLLQRLPGLGISSVISENRVFVDIDFADVCRAGDVVEYVKDPYNFNLDLFRKNECCLNELGIAVSAVQLPQQEFPEGKMYAAIQHMNDQDVDRTIKTDVIRIAAVRGDKVLTSFYIKDVILNNWDFNNIKGDIHGVTFQESYFGKLEIEKDIEANNLPHFSACFIGDVEGRTGIQDLPTGIFDIECVFDSFSDALDTTNGILQLALPLGSKVLLTILKKLYIQKGRGRRETALLRGLDQRGQRIVPEILELLEKEQLAICRKIDGRRIWFPDRSCMARVGKILSTPHESKDNVIINAGRIS